MRRWPSLRAKTRRATASASPAWRPATRGFFEFNPAALVFGPFWAAARGMWELAWGLLILHAVALMLFIGGLARDNPAMGAGILLSPAAALVFGALADRIYFWRFNRWRTNPQISSGFSRGRAFWCGCRGAGVLAAAGVSVFAGGARRARVPANVAQNIAGRRRGIFRAL